MQSTNRSKLILVLFVSSVLALVQTALAQSDSVGTITGHVYNPATKEYVRNAEVHVDGTNIVATTEVGGFYRLPRVPAGTVKVIVTYTGYNPASSEVTVTSGATATRDFEISASDIKKAEDGTDYVELQAFVVSSEREGNSKALQQARKSMTMSQSIATDAYGDVTEGNVGEFLKYLPGVELEYVEADTRGPRLGGLGSEYTSVTLDGLGVASADAFTQYTAFENSPAGSSNRSFGFEQVSINSIESIEINRVTSAAMDANAPAGNIDMKTKRAFDLKGRRINMSASTVFNTEEFTLNKTVGPNDGYDYKFKPNYNLSYSDVFFNNRLGILFGISESNLYNEQYRVDHTYNRTPTATDPRPQVLTQILLKDGPKWTERFTTTFTADLRATSNLTVSLNVIYNGYDARFYNRQATMQAAANNTGATTGRQTVSGDGVLDFATTTASTAASRQVVMGGGNGIKLSNTLTISPRFELKLNDITVDGAFSYSKAKNNYDNIPQGTVANTPVSNLTNVGFTGVRSGGGEADWKFAQTGGGDWANLANYLNPRISDDNRKDENELTQAQVNVKYVLPVSVPAFVQVGGKVTENHRITSNTNPYDNWSYVGPGGGTTGSFAAYPTPFELYGGGRNQLGVRFTSITGGGAPAFPNRDMLGALFRLHPEYFARDTNAVSLANYESGLYSSNPSFDITETIPSGYVMGNVRVQKLQLQGGVRYEETQLESNEWNPLTTDEMQASSFPTSPTTGAPTTREGVDYKYLAKPRVDRQSNYHDFFPSVTAKYNFTTNFQGDIGWGKAIKRPNLNQIGGTRFVNDEDTSVTQPNPGLQPERSQKAVGSLSYYFGKSGNNLIQIVGGWNRVIDQIDAINTDNDDIIGAIDPTIPADYNLISFRNASNPIEYKTFEVSYRQQLTFLPRVLQSTAINLSYTNTETSRRVYGAIPHSVKGGVSYRYQRFNFGFNGVWRDDTPWFQGTLNRYLISNVKYDFNAGFKVTNNLNFFVSARNIFETPHRIYEESTSSGPDVLYRYENYGTNWTMGFSGRF